MKKAILSVAFLSATVGIAQNGERYHCDDFSVENGVDYAIPERHRLDAFADAVPVYFGRAPSPKTPGIATWRSFRENFLDKDADKEILDSNPFPNRPLLMRTTGKRESSGTPPAKAF